MFGPVLVFLTWQCYRCIVGQLFYSLFSRVFWCLNFYSFVYFPLFAAKSSEICWICVSFISSITIPPTIFGIREWSIRTARLSKYAKYVVCLWLRQTSSISPCTFYGQDAGHLHCSDCITSSHANEWSPLGVVYFIWRGRGRMGFRGSNSNLL